MASAWKGADEALAKMRNLAPNLIKSGMKRSVRKGAVVVQKAAKANALKIDDPETKNNIARNIAVQYSGPLSKREKGVAYRVGVLGGARRLYANNKANRRKGIVGQETGGTGGSTWYWRFIELGTSKMRARPFMVPALTANIDRATSAIVSELGPALDRAVQKGR